MADWILTAKPHTVRVSSDPSPTTGWVKATRTQSDTASAIPQQYREGAAPVITEMNQATKDAVDATADVVAKQASVSVLNGAASYDLVRALGLVMFDEINTLRTNAGLLVLTKAQFKNALKGKM